MENNEVEKPSKVKLEIIRINEKKELAKTHIEKAYQLLQKNVKHIKEPYVERFEEVFPDQIEKPYKEIIK